jgi:hypothetical protein
MLKLFTDRSYVPLGRRYVPLLYPFWGFLKEDKSLDSERFSEYTKKGGTFFSLVQIEEADAVLLPCEWQDRGRYHEALMLAEKARVYKKPLIIFYNSDSDENIPISNAIIFRTSLFKSRQKTNEYALPGWSTDFLQAYCNSQLTLRDKQPIPSVGYTGYIDYHNAISFLRYLTNLIKNRGRKHTGAILRGMAVRLLSIHRQINTHFILRNGGMTGKANIVKRTEYVRNIIASDYSLIVRGGGNFSYRFYEVLSCGRIPLFVNTDCVLPFDHIIDWKKHMIWVEVEDIKSIAERVLAFHSSLSNEEFHDLQRSARYLYENWLCPTGFYSNIWRCLNTNQ